MDDRNEEVFQKYDLKINNMYRARGALLLDTNQGLKLFGKCGASEAHLEYENNVRKHLLEQGYQNIDIYIANKEGNLITEDSQGERYAVRNWFQGEECNLKDMEEAGKAAKNLAILHKAMSNLPFQEEFIPKDKKLHEVFKKHNRELKRVRSYILDKKQKNEFEVRFLKVFDSFYSQGAEAEEMLLGSAYEQMMNEAVDKGRVVHGSYNYHNVLFTRGGIATTNFDKAGFGIQIYDLYHFIRKAMEKNNWNIPFGMKMIESYNKEKQLEKDEITMLYILLLYPEKFWKVTNYYYNNKKSWISARNIQKLAGIQQQEDQKNLFLQKLKNYCIMK